VDAFQDTDKNSYPALSYVDTLTHLAPSDANIHTNPNPHVGSPHHAFGDERNTTDGYRGSQQHPDADHHFLHHVYSHIA